VESILVGALDGGAGGEQSGKSDDLHVDKK
jgi:hypothetical protein